MSVMSLDPARVGGAALPRSLVHDVLTQVPGADRELVDRFRGHVHRLLGRMLGPAGASDMDDLLQEVFFRVFARLHKVDPPDALPGYVTAVAVLVAREALRKRKRSRWLSFFSSHDLAELSSRRGGGSADIPEDIRSFYETVGQLNEHAQLYITLRYVEGMRLEEIATAMDVSLATAKRHLSRAELDFMALLGNDEQHVAPWMRGGVNR